MDFETFVHLELHGSADEVKAFVEGYRLASGEQRVYSTARENIKTQGFFGSLVSKAVHFVMPETFAGPLGEAIEAARLVDIRVENVRAIDHGELEFEFKCFSRSDGVAIQEVVETELPKGVVLEGYETDETIDSGAKGAEMYSPVHEYVLTGQGRFHGPIEGIIAMGRRLDDQDFIHPGRIHLVESR
jgi:hypothetical protein